MFDKEIVCYKVIINDEEEAVKAARKYISSIDIKYRVKIEQVCNVVGWWN